MKTGLNGQNGANGHIPENSPGRAFSATKRLPRAFGAWSRYRAIKGTPGRAFSHLQIAWAGDDENMITFPEGPRIDANNFGL